MADTTEPQIGRPPAVDADRWHWAHPEGKPVAVALADLRSLLSDGSVPPHAWVWRTGWKHWLPACRVKELSLSLGSRAREPQSPALDATQTAPPKVPVGRNVGLDIPRLSTPVPPPPRGQPSARLSSGADSGTASQPRTTLRPPFAVPPPPRGIPQSLLAQAEEIGLCPSAPGADDHFADGLTEPTIDVPEAEISATCHNVPEAEIPFDPDAAMAPGLGALHRAATTQPLAVQGRHRHRWTYAAIALALGCLATGTWLVLKPKTTPKPLPPPPNAPLSQPFACRIVATAQRVSPRVSLNISPFAIDADQANKVALGFAETANTAAGILVDPINLSIQLPYRETQERGLVSVTPKRVGEKIAFVTVRDGIDIRQARSVSNGHDFLFGVTAEGFARRVEGQPVETVWPLEPNDSVTDPRLVSNSGQGHAVTFRRNGQTGTILLGYLTVDGSSRTRPAAVDGQVKLLGTPSLAIGEETPRRLVVAYAGRNTDNEPWSLYVSQTEWGNPPGPAHTFTLPAGGPGGDAISPSLASLPEGRWLMQWSEGAAGNRVVRTQLLDRDLKPNGEAYMVSPLDRNSGQGVLWASQGRAVSFYVVSIGKQAELWATSLVCSK